MADLNFGTIYPETEALLIAKAVVSSGIEAAPAIGDIRQTLNEMTPDAFETLRAAVRLLDALAEEAHDSKDSDGRRFCPAVSRKGSRCDFAAHPGHVHWTWTDGWPRQWMALPGQEEVWQNLGATEDPLRDAPEALLAPGSS